MRATYKYKYRDEKGRAVLIYEYKGHEYEVIDYGIWMNEPLSKQHKEEQKKIDELIDHENDPIPEWKYEGSAQEGFDIFWDYVEGNKEL